MDQPTQLTKISYNGYYIRPTPTYSLSTQHINNPNGRTIGKTFNVTLNGTLLSMIGDIYTAGGTALVGDSDGSHDFEYLTYKENEVREIFRSSHLPCKIYDLANQASTPLIQFCPHDISIEFGDGIRIDRSQYTVNMSTNELRYIPKSGVSEVTDSALQLQQASDEFAFTVGDENIQLSRSIAAQGIPWTNDLVPTSMFSSTYAMQVASSWCHSSLANQTYFSAINATLSSHFGIPSSAFYVRSMGITFSEEAGNYAINATYERSREAGAYTTKFTTDVQRSDEEFLTLSTNYTVVGLGANYSSRLTNARSKFASLAPSAICSSIFTEVKNSIGYDAALTSYTYEVDEFSPSTSSPEGSINYSVRFRVTNSTYKTTFDNIDLTTNVAVDYNTGKFTISAQGRKSMMGGSGHTSTDTLTVPTYSDIMAFLVAKSIVPSAWSSKVKVTNITKSYSQATTLQEWTMNLEGNAIGSPASNIIIEKSLQHSVNPAQWKETISESISIMPADNLFNNTTFALNSSLLSSLETARSSYMWAANAPSSLYFSTATRAAALTGSTCATTKLSNGSSVSYSINREWVILPWSTTYIPDTIPLEDISIDVRRNYNVPVVVDNVVPGRLYGPLVQNMQTNTAPILNVTISCTPNRVLSDGSISLTSFFPTALTGGSTFYSGINFQGMADSIFANVFGSGIPVKRRGDIAFDISSAVAIVQDESDGFSCAGSRLDYSITYKIVNAIYA